MAEGRKRQENHSIPFARECSHRALAALFVLGVLSLTACAAIDAARPLAKDGSSGFVVQMPHARLQVCPFDLALRPLHAFYLDEAGVPFGSIAAVDAWLRQRGEHLLCASNGALFEVGQTPLGWLVVNGALLHALNSRTDGSGNFYLQPNGALVIDESGARIIGTRQLDDASLAPSKIALGLQSGPILLQDGIINPRLLPASISLYTRDAVCLTDAAHGFLLFAAKPVSLFQFSQALAEFGCRDALYLDGHLAQMWPDAEPLDVVQRQPLATIVGVTQKDK